VEGVRIGAGNIKKVIKVLIIKNTKKLVQQIPKKLDGFSIIIKDTGNTRLVKQDLLYFLSDAIQEKNYSLL
jgi:hypothetical protein